MKLNRQELLAKLEAVALGVADRENVDQSSCFVFKGNEIVTFNDEVACSIAFESDLGGAVKAKELIDLLGKMKEGELEVEVKDGELRLAGKRRKAGVAMEQEIRMPVDDVPRPEKWKKIPKGLAAAVETVRACVSSERDQHVLRCVHFHPEYVEACDNYQLIRCPVKIPLSDAILIRGDSLKGFADLKIRRFSESEAWVHWRNEVGLIVSCRREVERYPEGIDAMLEGSGEKIVLPKGLARATTKAAIFSAIGTDEDRLMIELRPGKMRLEGRGINGWYSEVFKVEYEGTAMQFMIAPALLGEVIGRGTECEVFENRLKIRGERFVYVTSLGKVKGKD